MIVSRDLEKPDSRLVWRYKYKYDNRERLAQKFKYDSNGREATTTTFVYNRNTRVISVVDPRNEFLTYQEMTFN